MWKVFQRNPLTGELSEREAYQDVGDMTAGSIAFSENPVNRFIFWDGPLPSNVADQKAITDKAFSLNGDRIKQITIGAHLPTPTKVGSMSSCSGDCFCVIQGGSRDCQTYYCFASGLCYWVSCGMGC